MKLNKISMFLAAMALVGCSNEDFNDPSVAQAIDDSSLVQLGENFILAGVGEDGNTMRTHWEQDPVTGALVNKFLPIYSSVAGDVAAGNRLDVAANLEAQAVGLCWLGQGAVGTDVYTNYQFYHFGWLNNDETSADIECNKLANGALYSDLELAAAGAVDVEAVETNFNYTAASLKVGTPSTDLNFNSGVYKTDNKAIFGGEYIVYYPYNANFKDAGTIPAIANTSFDWNVGGDTYQSSKLGQATFRYSNPVHIDGGNQAADFGLKNLSTLVRLRVSTVAGDANIGDRIDKIVLYSPSQKLLKQANLAADKIAAGKTGAELYASTEGTKTIATNFITTATALNVKATTTVSAYITVLPTTVDDLVALVHNSSDGTWATVDLGETEFEAGAAKVLDITVTAGDFTTDYIAVDQASLQAALTEANTAAGATATPTITVIGDITLSSNFNIDVATYPNIAKITITGDDIIVPEDVTLTLNNNNADVNRMESNIRVLGKSCCAGATGGRLVVEGGTIGNVTMEPTEAKVTAATYDAYNPQVTYQTAAVVASGKVDVKAGNVVVSSRVEHKGDIAIAEDAKLTVNATGDLKFVVSGNSQILNDGTIEVKGAGKFDITNISGTTTANDGKKMTNNGKFIHNVNAEVGTTVQSMNQNGEYRCKVANQNQLDDAYLQWTACNIIEMVNGAYTYDMVNAVDANKHNGKYIDVEVNSTGLTTFNNPTGGNVGDELEIRVGNLTVTAGGLDVVFVGTSGAKKQRTLTVNGDMTVKANTNLTNSKKINVTGNLTVEGAGKTLTYAGSKANVQGLAVTKDIKVIGATFNASALNALNITCANFYLEKEGVTGATATFGNRDASTAKNLVVSGTISNPADCTFTITAAAGTNLYAWVTCTTLVEGGTFSAARPRVVAAN